MYPKRVELQVRRHNILGGTDEMRRSCVFVFHCIQKNRKTAKPIKEFCRYTQYYYVDFILLRSLP